jgi:hypothetical protein
MLTLIKFMTGHTPYGSQAATIMSNLEYAPLPSAITSAVYEAAVGRQTSGTKHKCFNP